MAGRFASSVCAAVVLAGTVGCGDVGGSPRARVADSPAPSPTSTVRPVAVDAPEPKGLTCPGGEQVSMIADLAEQPDGYETREEAIELWLRSTTQFGSRYLIAGDGSGAWLLREDDTAVAKVGFIEHNGFTAHNYDACSG